MSQDILLEPVSNREDWDDSFQLFDDDTGDALDLSAVTAVTVTVWDEDYRGVVLSGSLSSGITINSAVDGTLSLHLAAASMNALCAKTYQVRLSMVNGGATKDLILGRLPVQDGGPT